MKNKIRSRKIFYQQRVFLFKIFKRFLDIFGSIFLLILFLPLLIPIIILIKFYSPGPIFFLQKRVGKKSKEFLMYKFRTMYTGDNDNRLKQYPKLWEKYKKLDWKLPLHEDPRVTPVGKFLRTLSLDEFPQLINILKGEMSLVGPRAYREKELQEYTSKYPETKKFIKIIRSTKPGLTGLWQTSGRNQLSFKQRAKMDAKYIKNRSFRQEVFIILKTPFVMLSRW
ncbi:sugar transferase [Patescibacteria group bacterium]|nr:sugar transferase [Patescibacteria group bacterium]